MMMVMVMVMLIIMPIINAILNNQFFALLDASKKNKRINVEKNLRHRRIRTNSSDASEAHFNIQFGVEISYRKTKLFKSIKFKEKE